MIAKVINQNAKRGTAMLTIVHEGRSYTRHCVATSNGWQGYVLDKDRAALSLQEQAWAQNEARLRSLGSTGGIVYAPKFMCAWTEGTCQEEYAKHIADDRSYWRSVIDYQQEALVKAEAEYAIRQAAQAARKAKTAA